MFKEARIKLTAWYLVIIMAISLSFSVVIYLGINRELTRFDDLQRARLERTNQINLFLRNNGVVVPLDQQVAESETLEQARLRIISTLCFINLSILVLAGAGGYFLAGQTLDPISEMVEKQKQFVSNASHELRTPLTSLKTEIEVALRDKKLTLPQAKLLLKSNLDDVNSIQKLSNYLLQLNRYENGHKLTMTKLDLAIIAKRAIGKRKIKTKLRKSIVKGNEESLIELVTILLDNASKYGSGKPIFVRTYPGGAIEVEDRGIGIPKSDLPHIFERFYRSNESMTSDGYGLGLSIAKSIVDLHGGSIKVTSHVGNGSTFRVQLS